MKTERENFPFRDSGLCDQCGLDFENHLRFGGGVVKFTIERTPYGDLLHHEFCDSYKMRIFYV